MLWYDYRIENVNTEYSSASKTMATSPPCPARASEACHPLGLPLLPQLPLKPPPSSGQQILPLEKFILILS